jgi:hypothetical protein
MALLSVPVSYALRHKDGQGWSETYHYVPPLGIPDAADVRALAGLRAGFLTSDVKITHARIGTDTKRLVQVVPLAGGAGIPGSLPPPTAPLEAAILYQLQAPPTGYNRIFARGFDAASVDGDTFTPSAAYSSAAGLWENYLQTSGLWNIVGTLGSSPTHHTIANLVGSPPRGLQFTSNDNLGTAGTIISIHNAVVPGYNGRKTILNSALSGTVYTYKAGGAAPPIPDTGTFPYALILTPNEATIQNVAFDKVTRRGVGRPFGLVRGRARTLYSLRP